MQFEQHLIFEIVSRKVSTEEKRNLGADLTQLSPEDLTRALEIVAQSNPGFQARAEEVDLDIDALVNHVIANLTLVFSSPNILPLFA